jgi:S-adenosylmethionine:tRNA ribosyltransferase-isomerase
LAKLEALGVKIVFVRLHVGAGTFLPVKVDDIADHKMHAEYGEVTTEAANAINTPNVNARNLEVIKSSLSVNPLIVV